MEIKLFYSFGTWFNVHFYTTNHAVKLKKSFFLKKKKKSRLTENNLQEQCT